MTTGVDCRYPFQSKHRVDKSKLFLIYFDHPDNGDIASAANETLLKNPKAQLYGLYWHNRKNKWALVCHDISLSR